MHSAIPDEQAATGRVKWEPPLINRLEDTRLQPSLLQDLALKTLYVQGQLTGHQIAKLICLPFQTVVRGVLDFLKREQYLEVTGSSGLGAGTYEYTLTGQGAARARDAFNRTAYVGPAPVAWNDYVRAMRLQGNERLVVGPQKMEQALAHMVLETAVFNKIGPAVNSGRSIFLYGPSGNGKTTIAESIGRLFASQEMYIPHAVVVDGQFIKVYDEINHERVAEPVGAEAPNGSRRADGRWLRIKRPVIMVGGELTLDSLELAHDPTHKYYEAPAQMKANGGMFLVDDFGRQQVRPRDLLNRWIVPMEKKVDFLSLRTGRKLEVPFEVLIVFATNLPPRDLVDEAFLRRIRHKIEVTSPSFDGYREIFRRACAEYDIDYDQQAVVYLLKEHYVKPQRPLRANHPRDLLEQLRDIAAYLDEAPRLTQGLLDRAVASYFVEI